MFNKEIGIEKIMTEIRDNIEGAKADGKTPAQVEAFITDSVKHTYLFTEQHQLDIIAQHPNAGFAFVHSVHESLGAVNEVVVKEYGFQPITLKDLDLISVHALEQITGQDIDELMTAIDKHLGGGLH
jgi:hypothetical protein